MLRPRDGRRPGRPADGGGVGRAGARGSTRAPRSCAPCIARTRSPPRRSSCAATGSTARAASPRAWRVAEDWDLWLRIAAAGGAFVCEPAARIRYRRHPGGLTADVRRLAAAQLAMHEAHRELVAPADHERGRRGGPPGAGRGPAPRAPRRARPLPPRADAAGWARGARARTPTPPARRAAPAPAASRSPRSPAHRPAPKRRAAHQTSPGDARGAAAPRDVHGRATPLPSRGGRAGAAARAP